MEDQRRLDPTVGEEQLPSSCGSRSLRAAQHAPNACGGDRIRGAATAAGRRQHHAQGRDARRGPAGRARPRPVGHAAERRPGVARAREARLSADLVRRARARRVAAGAELRVLGPGGRPRGRAGRARAGQAGAGGQLDGRRDGDGVHARAPRPRCRRSCRSPRPTPATRARATRTVRPGRSSPRRSTTGSTGSWRSRSRATCPSAGARSPARPPASGWSATPTSPPWRRRCARCRARSRGRASTRCPSSRCRCSWSGSQDDSDWLHPLGVAEEYCRKLPHCELVVEEKGDSPLAWQGARLSNLIARLLRARRLPRRTAALRVAEPGVGRLLY